MEGCLPGGFRGIWVPPTGLKRYHMFCLLLVLNNNLKLIQDMQHFYNAETSGLSDCFCFPLIVLLEQDRLEDTIRGLSLFLDELKWNY